VTALRPFHWPAAHPRDTVTVDRAALGEALAKLNHAAAGLAQWAESLPSVLRQLNDALTALDRATDLSAKEPRVIDLAHRRRVVR